MNAHLSEKMFPLELTEQERQDLVTFLEEALTGTVTEVEVPRLPWASPWLATRSPGPPARLRAGCGS
jgi:hypothetical protein